MEIIEQISTLFFITWLVMLMIFYLNIKITEQIIKDNVYYPKEAFVEHCLDILKFIENECFENKNDTIEVYVNKVFQTKIDIRKITGTYNKQHNIVRFTIYNTWHGESEFTNKEYLKEYINRNYVGFKYKLK